MRVLDSACGSGHFLLAAARRLGKELAKVRTGEDEPAPERVREAIREVVAHCIYGVDKNPLAVELCRVALWLEAHCAGKPLTFLDHHIRCGESLVGVLDLGVLEAGIPDEAFAPASTDAREAAGLLRKRNRSERRALESGQLRLPLAPERVVDALGARHHDIEAIADDSPAAVREKKSRYDRLLADPARLRIAEACDLWTAAFFQRYTPELATSSAAITTDTVTDRLAGRVHPQALAAARALAERHRFFHWPLEFPDVFAEGGFDVVLSNPPWERIKLQEQEFFAARDTAIAGAPNAAARKRLIARVEETNSALWQEYQEALHDADATSKFLRTSGRYPLTGRGDVNTYAVFTELAWRLLNPRGRAGLVVPTGIATDDTTKHLFGALVAGHALVSLYDFENREGLFPAVDSRMKFCLLTLTHGGLSEPARFAFFLHRAEQLREPERVFSLAPEDFALINPNTRTCPVFRSRHDAELTRAIYQRVPVLVREDDPAGNPWGVEFLRMFDMANDSGRFRTRRQLEAAGYQLVGNVFVRGEERCLPLYEAKLVHQFDHRWASYGGPGRWNAAPEGNGPPWLEQPARDWDDAVKLTEAAKADTALVVLPRYWVPAEEVEARLARTGWQRGWLLGWRDITNSTNERTVIAAVIPRVAVGDKFLLMFPSCEIAKIPGLLANLDSIAFDYIARQKLGGTSLKFYLMKQLPVLPPAAYARPCPWHAGLTLAEWFRPRVLELVYTAWDLEPFARDLGDAGPPFRWDEERRFQLRCELDAAFFLLYLGTPEEWKREATPELKALFPTPREAVAYILDQFPIVKRRDEERYGVYRTKETILKRYDEMCR